MAPSLVKSCLLNDRIWPQHACQLAPAACQLAPARMPIGPGTHANWPRHACQLVQAHMPIGPSTHANWPWHACQLALACMPTGPTRMPMGPGTHANWCLPELNNTFLKQNFSCDTVPLKVVKIRVSRLGNSLIGFLSK